MINDQSSVTSDSALLLAVMLPLNQSNANSNSTLKPWKSKGVALLSSLVAIVFLFLISSLFSWNQDAGDSTSNTISSPLRRMTGDLLSPNLDVFLAYSDSPVARKKLKDFGANDGIRIVVSNSQEQMNYFELNKCVDNALERYQAFVKKEQPHLAQELWKFCVLSHHGGLYVDAESPLLISVDEIRSQNRNVAITSDYFDNTIHGAILLLKDGHIAQQMAKLLVDTPVSTLIASPLIVAQTLYQLIHDENSSMSRWHLYKHSCVINALSGRKLSSYSPTNRLAHYCPLDAGYCCQVLDSQTVVMMTKHPILPNQILPETLPLTYNPSSDGDEIDEDLPYIATIQETTYTRPKDSPKTPNFFDTLLQNNCLPSDLQCSMCLRDKKGADCKRCKDVCPCYCKTLCKVSVDQKFVSKKLTVSSPRFARDPTRLVPRIIHQTWFETVSPEKYPNMSRLIESFKQSGWEYKFYDDDSSRRLLKKHFPLEVLQAYDALKPGAFKADLFRYCVLLIYGGIYADMDVLLESNLDAAVGPDVGFMVPVDEPGTVRYNLLSTMFQLVRKSHTFDLTACRKANVSMEWFHRLCPCPSFLSQGH